MTELVHRTIAALAGAVLMVLYGILTFEEAINIFAHEINTIGLIVGVMVMVEVTKESGLFQFLAVKVTKYSRGDPKRLLILFCILATGLSAVLDNITTMLILGSLTIVSCKELDVEPAPFLICIAIITNIGGITTLISSLPNILIGSAAGLNFNYFVINFVPFAIVAMSLTILLFTRIFRKELHKPTAEERIEAIMHLDEWAVVKDRKLFWRSLIILITYVMLFVISDSIGIGPHDLWYIAIAGAVALLLLSGVDPEKAFSDIEWNTIFFFIGLFVVVGGIAKVGVLRESAVILSNWTGGNFLFAVLSTLVLCGVLSAFIDNIPVTAVLIPVVRDMAVEGGYSAEPFWWSLVLGANLGGSFTPIGSPSNVIAMGAYYRHELDKEKRTSFFKTFIIVGSISALFHLLLSAIYIYIRITFGLYQQ